MFDYSLLRLYKKRWTDGSFAVIFFEQQETKWTEQLGMCLIILRKRVSIQMDSHRIWMSWRIEYEPLYFRNELESMSFSRILTTWNLVLSLNSNFGDVWTCVVYLSRRKIWSCWWKRTLMPLVKKCTTLVLLIVLIEVCRHVHCVHVQRERILLCAIWMKLWLN